MSWHPERCPYCNQVLPRARLGVALPPFKARIVDLVTQGGRDGIATDDLLAITYDGTRMWNGARSGGRGRDALKQHIRQINERLAPVHYRIINSAGMYRLERIG
jgi:predicted Rdx family selenoprotein